MSTPMSTDPITSSDNRWLKRVRKAATHHDEEILLEGPKQVEDALARGLTPIAIFVQEDRVPPNGSDPRIIHRVSERAFRSLGETATPQGVVALFARPETSLENVIAAPGSIVAVDGVQDPGNVGAIVRLAAAFDLAGVLVLSGSADPWSPRAIRGSAGAVLETRVATTTPARLREAAEAAGRPMLVAMPSGPSIDRGLPPDAIVVLGSEGRGVSSDLVAAASPFSIPTSGRVESLNVATAAAIAIWEMTRSGRR